MARKKKAFETKNASSKNKTDKSRSGSSDRDQPSKLRQNSGLDRERWILFGAFVVIALGGYFLIAGMYSGSEVTVYDFRVIRTIPHDTLAFSQGLVYENGKFYESTGQEGESSVRIIDGQTGEVEFLYPLEEEMFGEGLTLYKDQLYQLTWQNGKIFVYDRKDLKLIREMDYEGEGWGLTHNNRHFFLSDGTGYIHVLEPETFKFVKLLEVKWPEGNLADELNELEFIEGYLYANVWHEDYILRIDPSSGLITAKIDLTDLYPHSERPGDEAVLNGIAYDRENGHIYVTGKDWPRIYQIEIFPKPKTEEPEGE